MSLLDPDPATKATYATMADLGTLSEAAINGKN